MNEDEDDGEASLLEGNDSEEDGESILGEDEESDDPLATSDEEEEASATSDDDSEDVELDDVDDDSSEASDSEEETQAEKDRKAAFFASSADLPASSDAVHTSFTTMSLSRPLLKALTTLGFTTPTPIQAATIPVALLGKDVVGNAVTGSGKTAAFMVPILERLMYRERGKSKAAVRCVVLVPTRELGVQCADVARKLATFMDVRIALIVGT